MNRPDLNEHNLILWIVRVGVAASLVVSAVIHVQLAPGYQQAAPGGFGQGTGGYNGTGAFTAGSWHRVAAG